jgi:hypothetical protein
LTKSLQAPGSALTRYFQKARPSRKPTTSTDEKRPELWQIATGGRKREPLIEDAVLIYLERHAPGLKNRVDLEGALALLMPHYAGRPLSELPDVAKEYSKDAKGERRRAVEAGHGEEPASVPAGCLPLGVEA